MYSRILESTSMSESRSGSDSGSGIRASCNINALRRSVAFEKRKASAAEEPGPDLIDCECTENCHTGKHRL